MRPRPGPTAATCGLARDAHAGSAAAVPQKLQLGGDARRAIADPGSLPPGAACLAGSQQVQLGLDAPRVRLAGRVGWLGVYWVDTAGAKSSTRLPAGSASKI